MLYKKHVDMEVCLPKLVYCPGDVICGSVMLFTRTQLHVQTIEVKFCGYARVRFRDREFPEFHASRPLYFQSETLLVERSVVAYEKPPPLLIQIDDIQSNFQDENANTICPQDCHSDGAALRAGRHKFTFEVQLPSSGLETSFAPNSSPATIQYSISAFACGEDGSTIAQCSQPVTIIKMSRQAVSRTAARTLSKVTEVKRIRHVSADLKLFQNCYKPAEPIQAEIFIDNGWKESLKYVYFNLVQRVTYTGRLEGSTHCKTLSKDINLTGVSLPAPLRKIAPASALHYSPQYCVPALIPSFCIPSCVEVDYFAKLAVGRSQNEIFVEVTVPITIATHTE